MSPTNSHLSQLKVRYPHNPLIELAIQSTQNTSKNTTFTPLQLMQMQKLLFAASNNTFGVKKSGIPRRIRHSKQPGLLNRRTCLVCGEKAINYNFGVITCESCKAFFRRNIDKIEGLQCSNEDWSCVTTVETRRFCSACRMKKCFQIGMVWTASNSRHRNNPNHNDSNDVFGGYDDSRPSSLPSCDSSDMFSHQPTAGQFNSHVTPHDRGRPSSAEQVPTDALQPTFEEIEFPPTSKADLCSNFNNGYFTSQEWDKITKLAQDYEESVVNCPFSMDVKNLLLGDSNDLNVNSLIKTCDFLVENVISFLKNIPEFVCLRQLTKKTIIVNQITIILTVYGIMKFDTTQNAFMLTFADGSHLPVNMYTIAHHILSHLDASRSSSAANADQSSQGSSESGVSDCPQFSDLNIHPSPPSVASPPPPATSLSFFACIPEYQNYVRRLRESVLGDEIDLAAILFCLKVFESPEKHSELPNDSAEFLAETYQHYIVLFYKLLALKFPADYDTRFSNFKKLQSWTVNLLEPECESLIRQFGVNMSESGTGGAPQLSTIAKIANS